MIPKNCGMKLPRTNVKEKMLITSNFENNKQKSAEIWKGIRSLVNIKSTNT